jgi:Maltokinase N-terminal cap domain
VAKVHPGATLTPHFRDFLPQWVARQPWYQGSGIPSLTPVGYFRFEDPSGEVGIETHLVTDGLVVYQVPMTYRGAPLKDGGPAAAAALVATAEHSVLGTRWIYDGEADPVWRSELLRLVRAGGVSEPGSKRGVAPAEARGHLLTAGKLTVGSVTIELRRVLAPRHPAGNLGAAGLVIGTWHPGGPGTAAVTSCLAVVRAVAGERTSDRACEIG